MSRLQVRTNCDFPPVPDRRFDWSAVTDNYDIGGPIGCGSTEFLAIFDLLKQLEEKRVGWPDMLTYTDSPQPQRVNGEQAPPGLVTLACSLNCRECKRTLVPGELYADGFRDGSELCHGCKADAAERSFIEAEEELP